MPRKKGIATRAKEFLVDFCSDWKKDEVLIVVLAWGAFLIVGTVGCLVYKVVQWL